MAARAPAARTAYPAATSSSDDSLDSLIAGGEGRRSAADRVRGAFPRGVVSVAASRCGHVAIRMPMGPARGGWACGACGVLARARGADASGFARSLAPRDDQTQASVLGQAQTSSRSALHALRERARQRGIDLEEERRRSLGRQSGADEVRCLPRAACRRATFSLLVHSAPC